MTGESFALSLDVSAVPMRPGGVGYYTMEMARGLSARQDVSLTMVSRRGDEDRWETLVGGAGSVVGAVPVSKSSSPPPPSCTARRSCSLSPTARPPMP